MAALLFTAATPAASGDTNDVVWHLTGCDETVAVFEGAAPDPGLLVVLAYRCSEATIGKIQAHDLAVSEISVLHPDGTSELLRQVTDNKALHEGLRELGLKESFFGTIDYAGADIGLAPEVRVSFRGRSYAFSPIGATGIPPVPSLGGASYTYEGKKGTIKLTYENHMQSFTPAAVTVDASNDPALRKWMGTNQATGTGVIAAGAWTGTATIVD